MDTIEKGSCENMVLLYMATFAVSRFGPTKAHQHYPGTHPGNLTICKSITAEVRNTATSSLLSLMQMNKAITKTVKDSEKQQQVPASPQQPQSIIIRTDSLTQDQYRNPREFLTNYVCHLNVWEPYHFQNSRGITLCSTYPS